MAHVETERRFLIKKPNPDFLKTLDGYTESNIEQIYLISRTGSTHRIRLRKQEGRTICTETIKERISKMSAVERERQISEEEYYTLSLRRDPSSSPIVKIRRTFSYRGRLMELDEYPHWHSVCLLEVELEGENALLELPPFLEVIREITGESRYSNAAMSRSFPEEQTLLQKSSSNPDN